VPVAYSSAALAGTGRTGAVVLLRDTSRDREVERMKTEFLSNVSHELRTPLTPIRGYAEILRRPKGVTSAQRDNYLGTIADSAVRMTRVVDLIVDVAAIDAGRVSWAPREVSVGSWVDERLALWRKRAPERADDLRRRVAARLPDLLVDPVWLGKAVDELVDNALKHSPAGTPVTLFAAASPDGSTVRVGVKDAGPGVDPEALPELFTDFRQVDGSATRRVGGLGLGLSFVRRIADAQGLGLVVTSTPRKGAEFAHDVPVAAAPRPRRRAARGTPAQAPSPRAAGNRRRPR
jgi:signal transduction histidine kinase